MFYPKVSWANAKELCLHYMYIHKKNCLQSEAVYIIQFYN